VGGGGEAKRNSSLSDSEILSGQPHGLRGGPGLCERRSQPDVEFAGAGLRNFAPTCSKMNFF
jgi:hypothetical protein